MLAQAAALLRRLNAWIDHRRLRTNEPLGVSDRVGLRAAISLMMR